MPIFGFTDIEVGLALALIVIIFFIWLGEHFNTGGGPILGGTTALLLAFELQAETNQFELPLLVVGGGLLLIAYGVFPNKHK